MTEGPAGAARGEIRNGRRTAHCRLGSLAAPRAATGSSGGSASSRAPIFQVVPYFPIAVIALLGVVIAGRASAWTALGGWIWLCARTIYLPLYGFGVPVVRTVVFAISLIGLALVLKPLLIG